MKKGEEIERFGWNPVELAWISNNKNRVNRKLNRRQAKKRLVFPFRRLVGVCEIRWSQEIDDDLIIDNVCDVANKTKCFCYVTTDNINSTMVYVEADGAEPNQIQHMDDFVTSLFDRYGANNVTLDVYLNNDEFEMDFPESTGTYIFGKTLHR